MRRLLVFLLAGTPATLAAQQPQPAAGSPPASAPARPAGPYRNFNDLTKDAVVRTGYFDSYQKEDKLYLAIPKDRLGKDFLMEMKIAQGIGTNGLFGGTMLSLFEANVVAIERHGEQPADVPIRCLTGSTSPLAPRCSRSQRSNRSAKTRRW